jgi:8-oxo-dGTP pyrophosphatase MutT (NUDIX family)
MTEQSSPLRASTIVLVRRSENDRFEIFMTRRPNQMRFLGGFFVFPGGSVKRSDSSKEMLERCRGLSPEEARKHLGDNLSAEHSLGHWVAAIRELYEEAGVLLVVKEDGGHDVDAAVCARISGRRESLLQGSVSFPELLREEELYCDVGRPVYFYHRVTPEHYTIRFDTRFYLAPLPEGQVPLSRSEEVAESIWITPEEGLNRAEQGLMPVIPPTLTTLQNLAELKSWDALCAEFGL